MRIRPAETRDGALSSPVRPRTIANDPQRRDRRVEGQVASDRSKFPPAGHRARRIGVDRKGKLSKKHYQAASVH